MSARIHTYTVAPGEFPRLPRGARIVSAGAQDDHIVVWAEVDPAGEPVDRRVHVVPTGGEVPTGHYVATVQTPDGLVFHVYDEQHELSVRCSATMVERGMRFGCDRQPGHPSVHSTASGRAWR